MKPAKRSKEELLAWVAAMIQREQIGGMTGTIRISLQEGVIQRANIERIELPGEPERRTA
ncbi:MAG: hypothetical protein AB7O46_00365 [Xanthobacteraceae bacterium]|nr:hypothetical protein [Xanthobacteraceae bacterium]